MPKWLDAACPWRSKKEFLLAKQENSWRLQELQQFLIKTIPLQAEYLVYRLEIVVPQILNLVPAQEKLKIQQEIKELMQTPIGIYSLIDYINFNGDGIVEYQKSLSKTQSCEQVYTNGWGL